MTNDRAGVRPRSAACAMNIDSVFVCSCRVLFSRLPRYSVRGNNLSDSRFHHSTSFKYQVLSTKYVWWMRHQTPWLQVFPMHTPFAHNCGKAEYSVVCTEYMPCHPYAV